MEAGLTLQIRSSPNLRINFLYTNQPSRVTLILGFVLKTKKSRSEYASLVLSSIIG